jgi:hypothetical protein
MNILPPARGGVGTHKYEPCSAVRHSPKVVLNEDAFFLVEVGANGQQVLGPVLT